MARWQDSSSLSRHREAFKVNDVRRGSALGKISPSMLLQGKTENLPLRVARLLLLLFCFFVFIIIVVIITLAWLIKVRCLTKMIWTC